MTAKKPAKPVLDHHYYGTTANQWFTRDTRDEVIKALARNAGANAIRWNNKTNDGLYCRTVRVNLPGDAPYKILGYMPIGVPMEDAQEHRITSVKGTYHAEPKGEES